MKSTLAIAENALLALQPVFPSKDRWFLHKVQVSVTSTLRLTDLAALGALGVDVGRYAEREYGRTQEMADAAYVLGLDGLVVLSARWTCSNLVLFTDRIAPEQIEIVGREELVAWDEWRRTQRR